MQCCQKPHDISRSAEIRPVSGRITFANRWDHFKARIGINRMGHLVEPGLYSIGAPDKQSPVFVTANYTLSFDAVRSAISGMDAYILVLDTKGVNVWCAAGKGTFGTNELVKRIESVSLKEVVDHRRLILPMLGGPGVAANIAKKLSGFKVIYGPALAADIPEYMKTGEATPEMRRMRFPLWDRIVLIPMELIPVAIPALFIALLLGLLLGPLASWAALAAVLAGTALFPILLPVLPYRDFSANGMALGAIVSAPFALAAYGGGEGEALWTRVFAALFMVLFMSAITSFLAINFTGSTTFTSPTAVRREIYKYVPVMAWMLGIGLGLAVAASLGRYLGG